MAHHQGNFQPITRGQGEVESRPLLVKAGPRSCKVPSAPILWAERRPKATLSCKGSREGSLFVLRRAPLQKGVLGDRGSESSLTHVGI